MVAFLSHTKHLSHSLISGYSIGIHKDLAAPVKVYSFSLNYLDSSPDLYLTFSSQASTLHQGVNTAFLLLRCSMNSYQVVAVLILSSSFFLALVYISDYT